MNMSETRKSKKVYTEEDIEDYKQREAREKSDQAEEEATAKVRQKRFDGKASYPFRGLRVGMTDFDYGPPMMPENFSTSSVLNLDRIIQGAEGRGYVYHTLSTDGVVMHRVKVPQHRGLGKIVAGKDVLWFTKYNQDTTLPILEYNARLYDGFKLAENTTDPDKMLSKVEADLVTRFETCRRTGMRFITFSGYFKPDDPKHKADWNPQTVVEGRDFFSDEL
ncbi:hypothetical protein LTR27_007580 [Elasticomyces elasticus]|nr:hypothetical protein LTR27_007580 [Elasticomyces elasticus]